MLDIFTIRKYVRTYLLNIGIFLDICLGGKIEWFSLLLCVSRATVYARSPPMFKLRLKKRREEREREEKRREEKKRKEKKEERREEKKRKENKEKERKNDRRRVIKKVCM